MSKMPFYNPDVMRRLPSLYQYFDLRFFYVGQTLMSSLTDVLQLFSRSLENKHRTQDMLQTFFISLKSNSFNSLLPNILIFTCNVTFRVKSHTLLINIGWNDWFEGLLFGFVLSDINQLQISSVTGRCLADLNMNVDAFSNTNLQEKEK